MQNTDTLTGAETNRAIRGAAIFLNLLRHLCRVNAGPLSILAAAWILVLWILPVFNHPGWILAFGVLASVVLAPALAGRDVLEGSEEFEFALPVSREEHYLSRWIVGFVAIALLCGAGVLAITFNLPQQFWGLVAESGFTEPNPPVVYAYVRPLAVLLPLAAYGCSFAFAAASRSRRSVVFSWLFGCLVTGLTTGVSIWAESWNGAHGTAPNGWIALPALLGVLALSSIAGFVCYRRKETTGDDGTAGAHPLGWLWATLLAIGLILFLLLSASVA